MKMHTIQDVANMLSVSTKTIYRLINHGHLVPVKIGRATRIQEDQINEYLNSLPGGLR